ncbi:MAG: DUF1343 domain-containing protein [Flavobacteriales bacterium]|nr:DUF1343 domain-containing protein [Flavobacteriales bacterium]
MRLIHFFLLFLFLGSTSLSFSQKGKYTGRVSNIPETKITVGAERMDLYLYILKGKSIAVVANQTSMVGNVHLVDTLLSLGVNIVKVFSPEHGFRGSADAGEKVKNYKDKKTGLPIVSLYGNNHKPSSENMAGVDIVIFDIQDVGVRFYTYISTMHYVMEACAENNIKFLVLDRPNPNGFYVAGPVREEEYKSFVGMHPVPLVHGMTMAEYAKMINGRGWLKNKVKCDLIHILCEGYDHSSFYELPIRPSPNLPNMKSVYLYPSLGLFEGTFISVGRGTDFPFQALGHPDMEHANFKFKPKSTEGAKNPPFKGKECMGHDLRKFNDMILLNYKGLYLYWLTGAYKDSPDKENFFNHYFNTLAGNSSLRQQIIDGIDEDEIAKTWNNDLLEFKKIRRGYLLYPDFE